MNATTPWLEDIQKKQYPSLNTNVSTDVVIIGAGLAGTITAYLLAKEGKKVVLIDKGKDIEDATSAYTTAWITADLDTDFSDLVWIYGGEKMKALWQSGNAAIDSFEQIIKEENIECEFARTPVYQYAVSEKQVSYLEAEYEAIQKAKLDISLKKEVLPGFKNSAYLEMPHQAKFHPTKFILALQEAAVRYGAQIYFETEAVNVEGNSPILVTTKNGFTISADYSVMMTHAPFKNPKELFAHKGKYVSYVLEVEIPAGLIKEGMYLDLAAPYHYFRIDARHGYDRMLLGGEDHRVEIKIPKDKNYQALEDYLKTLIPDSAYHIVRKWDGGILENIDGLPYMGVFSKKKNHQLVATAFSGNGMHFSMIAAQVCRDIILRRENSDNALYSASRKINMKALWIKGKDYTVEFFGGAVKNMFK